MISLKIYHHCLRENNIKTMGGPSYYETVINLILGIIFFTGFFFVFNIILTVTYTPNLLYLINIFFPIFLFCSYFTPLGNFLGSSRFEILSFLHFVFIIENFALFFYNFALFFYNFALFSTF